MGNLMGFLMCFVLSAVVNTAIPSNMGGVSISAGFAISDVIYNVQNDNDVYGRFGCDMAGGLTGLYVSNKLNDFWSN